MCDTTDAFVPNNRVFRFLSSKLVLRGKKVSHCNESTKRGNLMRNMTEKQRECKS